MANIMANALKYLAIYFYYYILIQIKQLQY